MDLFTHFIIPFFILTLLKSRYRLEGGLGGISVDFDFLIVWIGILAPELFIFTHRGITHTLIFGFVTSLIFLYVLSRPRVKNFLGKLIKRPLPIVFNRYSVMIVYFGALTHFLLDFLTTMGIPLLYPFSLTRYSAELYYYTDALTALLALGVLIILYWRIDPRYKKWALSIFVIILICFGGIRAYEKYDSLQTGEKLINGDIKAYPTPDLFNWKLVGSKGNGSYTTININNWDKSYSNQLTFNCPSITGGNESSALNAINNAETLPEVEKFRWNAYYTCINASYDNEKWVLTYYDFLSPLWRSNLTIQVPN